MTDELPDDAPPGDRTFEMGVLAQDQVLDFFAEAQTRMGESSMDLAELARKIGVERRQLNRLFSTQRGLRAKTLFLIARGLGYRLRLDWEKATSEGEPPTPS